MKLIGLIASLAAGACLLTTPLLAEAHNLSISNNTETPLSFSVNKVCSADLGTVYEMQVSTIPQATLNRVCNNFISPCKIVAYNALSCHGKAIGGMKYLDEHSIKVFSYDNKISVSASDSSLFFTRALAQK